MKKTAIGIILVSLIVSCFVVFIKSNYGFDTIIEYDRSKEGDFIYLGNENNKYYLEKLDEEGKRIRRKVLPTTERNKVYDYSRLVTDDKGNAYVLVTETNTEDKMLLQYVQVYDGDLEAKKQLFTIDYSNQLKRLDEHELIHLQFVEGKLIAFEKVNTSQLKLLQYDLITGDLLEKTFVFKEQVAIREVTYSIKGSIYFTNPRSQLFIMDEGGYFKEIIYTGKEKKNIVPYELSCNLEGQLFFTDVYNFTYTKYDRARDTFEDIYTKDSQVTKDFKFSNLRHLRNSKGQFIAVTSGFSDEGIQLVAFQEKSETIVEKGQIPFIELLGKVLIFFVLIGGALTAIAIAFIYIKKIRSLMLKQGLIILPLVIIMALVMIYKIKNEFTEIINKEVYQQLYMMSNSIVQGIDGDELEKVNFPQVEGDAFYEQVAERINLDNHWYSELISEEMQMDLYYILYYMEDGVNHIGFEITGDSGILSGTRDEYIVSNENDWYLFNNPERKPLFVTTTDILSTWMVTSNLILNSKGEIVGCFEVGTDATELYKIIQDTSTEVAGYILGITLIIVLIIMFTIKKSLSGLKTLKHGVTAISEGNWNTTVDIASNDEIEDIGNAFNHMAYKIKKYLDSIMRLNVAYEKFVPNEIFKLLNKDNILEISLGDQVIKNMHLLSISTKDFYTLSKQMSTQDNFAFLNQLFGMLGGAIKATGGVIESYEGAGLRAIYTKRADEALDAALAIVEKLDSTSKKVGRAFELNMIIQNSNAMIGIVGDKSRMEASVVSQAVNFAYILEKITEENKINLLITGEVVDHIDKKDKYNYRYMGRVRSKENGKLIDLYDVIDAYGFEEKQTKLMTKEEFEKGVKAYIVGDFKEARKKFIEVVREDRKDEIAKEYIFLCDYYVKENVSHWEGTMMRNSL